MRIVAAAVKCNGLTISLPAPARHYQILAKMPARMATAVKPSEQGFLTDGGDFIGREDAKTVAREAGQLLKEAPQRELFSEDLW